MERYRIETAKARAAGLGSAKSGFGHWWVERITAVVLLPLGIWFTASLIAHAGSDYETFVHWLGMPINAVLMVLLLVVLFWHAALGLQVVIEDYIHSSAKVWLVLVARFACFALTVTGIMATLRIAFEVWGAT
jgi:succinate dehydrogenase / fumarate reductase membrane anchor subunit